MSFSGALTLTDLNDYLGPSQACIKPVEAAPQPLPPAPGAGTGAGAGGAASTEIAVDADGAYYEQQRDPASAEGVPAARERTKLETAQISLNDCLACSGCVTSAESVLVAMQTHDQLREQVAAQLQAEAEVAPASDPHDASGATERRGNTLRTASIAPQVLASLAAKYFPSRPPSSSSVHIQQQQQQQQQQQYNTDSNVQTRSTVPAVRPMDLVLFRVRYFLSTYFAFHHVYDTTFARRVALRQSYNEYRSRRKCYDEPTTSHHTPSAPVPPEHDPTQPMLASSCPGWILFAEKTHPELLPFISRAKSPQQIAGVLARFYLLPRSNALFFNQDDDDDDGGGGGLGGGGGVKSRPPPMFQNVYHATIMPCYDKKLEASRKDFEDEVRGWKEVDVVLTTGELEKLMEEEQFDITSPVPGEEHVMAEQHAGQRDSILSPTLSTLSSSASASDAAASAAASSLASVPTQKAVLRGGASSPWGSTSTDPQQQGKQGKTSALLPLLLPSGLSEPGSSSGGFLFHLLSSVARDFSQAHPTLARPVLAVNVLRNADYVEYTLRAPAPAPAPTNTCSESSGAAAADERPPTEGTVLFRAATCYGFRNLTNLVKKVQVQTGTSRRGKGVHGLAVMDSKPAAGEASGANPNPDERPDYSPGGGGARASGRGGARGRGAGAGAGVRTRTRTRGVGAGAGGVGVRSRRTGSAPESQYDYVEVMACPSGCINGGGQLRPPSSSSSSCSTSPADRQETRSAADGGDGGGTDAMDMEGADARMLSGWQGTSKEWVLRVEESYWGSAAAAAEEARVNPLAHPREAALELYRSLDLRAADAGAWLDLVLGQVGLDLPLDTQYHALPSEETNGLAVQW